MSNLNHSQFPDYESTEGAAGRGGWRQHAISEQTGRTNEPGTKWDRYTALVPVHQLKSYAEYDRTGSSAHAGGRSAETINKIAADLHEGGHDAIREPLWMKYDHKEHWGTLVEGNHRLAAAIKAGVTHLPVAVTTGANLSERKNKGVGAPLHIDNRLVEQGGYMPSDVHPGNFKQFEGSR